MKKSTAPSNLIISNSSVNTTLSPSLCLLHTYNGVSVVSIHTYTVDYNNKTLVIG